MSSTAALLGLGAALSFGLGDFLGGALSRRMPALTLLVLGQGAALLVLLPATLLLPGTPSVAAFAWGAGAGVAGAAGSYCFLRGFAAGRFAVVTPAASVTAAGLPVLLDLARGLAISPTTAIGMGLALLAVALVGAREPTPTTAEPAPGPAPSATADHARAEGHARGLIAGRAGGLGWGLGAGSAHAAMYVLLGQSPAEAGLWPATTLFGVLVAVALAALAVRRGPVRVPPRRLLPVLAVGVLSAAGTVAYLLAAGAGTVGVAAVTTELSPVVTAVLARSVLAEPLPPLRASGLVLALAAGVLISTG